MVQAIARLEVSSSNPSLCMCAYFIKKNYTSIVEVLWWWPISWNIFLFRCFQVFSNFFIFYKIICRGESRTRQPLQIHLYGWVSSWSDPLNTFVEADTLPPGSTSRHNPIISLANRNKPHTDHIFNGRCTCPYLFIIKYKGKYNSADSCCLFVTNRQLNRQLVQYVVCLAICRIINLSFSTQTHDDLVHIWSL